MAVFNILISKVRWQTWRWRRWMVYSPWLLKLPFGLPEIFQPKSLNCTIVDKGNCPTQRFRILRRYVWRTNRGHHFESNNSQLIQLEGGVTSTNPEFTITFRLRMLPFSLYTQQVWLLPGWVPIQNQWKTSLPRICCRISLHLRLFHSSWTKSQVILIWI